MKVVDDLELYESNEYVGHYHQEAGNRIDQILKKIELNKSDVVVDFACGNGLLAPEISEKVNSYVGVDFSSLFIKKANQLKSEKQLDNVQFVCGDIIEFSEKNRNKFDKAFALDFTEHLNDENFKLIFRAIRSSLKKNGELIIHTPNGEYFLEILKEKGLLKQVSGHIGIRNYKEYKDLLSSAGFSYVKVTYLNHYVKVLKLFGFLSYIPWIGKFFKARLLLIAHY